MRPGDRIKDLDQFILAVAQLGPDRLHDQWRHGLGHFGVVCDLGFTKRIVKNVCHAV